MPQRPPRKWFYACVRSVGKDPAVTDPKAVCAWNWYYHMTPTRRREILRGELFDPDIDIERVNGNSLVPSFIFDPSVRRRKRLTYRIRMTFGNYIKVHNQLARIFHTTRTPRPPLLKKSKITLVFYSKRAWEKAKAICQAQF